MLTHTHAQPCTGQASTTIISWNNTYSYCIYSAYSIFLVFVFFFVPFHLKENGNSAPLSWFHSPHMHFGQRVQKDSGEQIIIFLVLLIIGWYCSSHDLNWLTPKASLVFYFFKLAPVYRVGTKKCSMSNPYTSLCLAIGVQMTLYLICH